jgi:methylated-DNA-[protein]-cysteine S-methyltransferase
MPRPTRLARRAGAAAGEPPPAIQRAIASITALLDGLRTDLTFIACDFSNVEPFATRVYIAARAIPAGETLTYGALALRLGDKLLAQRIGQALGRNPFPIIVPCHRVIGANGRLIGFSANGGVETKLRMLAIEGARVSGRFGAALRVAAASPARKWRRTVLRDRPVILSAAQGGAGEARHGH